MMGENEFSASWGWHKVLDRLEHDTGEGVDILLSKIDVVALEEDTLMLYIKNPFLRSLVEEKQDEIAVAASAVWGRAIQIQFLDTSILDVCHCKRSLPPSFNSIAAEMTFETFQVGEPNRFVHAAAIAVAQNPGQIYNPLVIHGNNGMGKTHLLYAIGNKIKSEHPENKVVYINGDSFIQDLIYALRNGTREEFEAKYHQADVLLMDDIQFIAGKSAIQEEFFYLFNHYYQNKKQIVVSCDRPLSEFAHLEHRLATRLSSGLLADIELDVEVKNRIVQQFAEKLGVCVADMLQKRIAELAYSGNEIRGAILNIKAMTELGIGISEDSIIALLEN